MEWATPVDSSGGGGPWEAQACALEVPAHTLGMDELEPADTCSEVDQYAWSIQALHADRIHSKCGVKA